MKNKSILGLVGIVTICLVIGGIFFLNIPERATHKFLLPQGYTGWVEVTYEQPGYPVLKKENDTFIYEVPSSGKIMTSSPNITGSVVLSYLEPDGSRTDFPTDVRMIHGLGTSSGGRLNADGSQERFPEKLTFFVGTEEQWGGQPSP